MTNSFNPVLFGIVVVLASVLVAVSQPALASAGVVSPGVLSGNVVSDLDLDEAVEAENATMIGATNQTTTNGNMTEVEFLSVQTAQSGSISQVDATAYTLELNDVANKTILFSDRPERIVETVSTTDFVGNWTTGPNSFAADVPNDALIVEDAQLGQLETAIIELFNPVYDTTANTLTYTIMAENATSTELPGEFGRSVLVIDAQAPVPIVTHLHGGDVR